MTGAKQRYWAGAGILVMLVLALLLLAPCKVWAYEPEIREIDIKVELHEDGSASFTEVWDVTTASGTEFYIPKYNMDGRVISDFRVVDENGTEFTDIGSWRTEASRQDKAQKSGLVKNIKDGYELCWGFGSYGEHRYTLTYTMTDLVRSYQDADVLYQQLVPKDLFAPVQNLKIQIQGPNQALVLDNTRLWAFGFSVDFGLENGEAVFISNRSLKTSEYAVALLRFDKGMFAPAKSIDMGFEELKKDAMKGSNYPTDDKGGQGGQYNGGGGNTTKSKKTPLSVVFWIPIVLVFGFVMIPVIGVIFGVRRTKRKKQKKEDQPYCRTLPYKGSVKATYASLLYSSPSSTDNSIIGAYILQWIRTRQVEMVMQPKRKGSKKQEAALKLYDPRPGMEKNEYDLYMMLVRAAGADWILQSKEFKKWSEKHYSKVSAWLTSCKNSGVNEIRAMGGIENVPQKSWFGLLETTKSKQTPFGLQMEQEMYGFKKYLKDFTIINEREAREVQLWDEYLVFAQLFGIADTVAEQFKNLYPEYFVQMANSMGMNPDLFDIYMMTRIASSYNRAMMSGYHAGNNASLSSGSGGSYSGGGGFSGGGFSSGGGTR